MNPLGETLQKLAQVLNDLGIRYAIGGSMASAARGLYRATNDADLVAAIHVRHADQLAAALGQDWYADAVQIREALRAGRSFNFVYLPFSQKVDIFPATEEFHEVQLQRATPVALPFLGEGEYPVTSAEDILLAKLRWYRDGGEVSDRQWHDIAGIVALNENLDLVYLRQWAARLRVSDLLERALREKQ